MRSQREYRKNRDMRTEFWDTAMSRSGENEEELAKNKRLRKSEREVGEQERVGFPKPSEGRISRRHQLCQMLLVRSRKMRTENWLVELAA